MIIKLFSFFKVFIGEKCIVRILTVCSFKLMHCMPSRTTVTSFRAPIPAISHFDLFGSRPEIFEKLSKTKIHITDVCCLTAKVELAYAVYKRSCSNILSLPMF